MKKVLIEVEVPEHSRLATRFGIEIDVGFSGYPGGPTTAIVPARVIEPAHSAQDGGEVVAWMTADGLTASDAEKKSNTARTLASSFTIPLYTRPAPAEPPKGEALAVWFGSMPESNGKKNWTAILHRGDITEGFTIARSEYPDRVRYDADCVKYLIGELKVEPDILEYDGDLLAAPAEPVRGEAGQWMDMRIQMMREFIAGMAMQKPEKPDYWSSCGQCERNISAADELMDVLAAPPASEAQP